jgi:hypothetical protein
LCWKEQDVGLTMQLFKNKQSFEFWIASHYNKTIEALQGRKLDASVKFLRQALAEKQYSP